MKSRFSENGEKLFQALGISTERRIGLPSRQTVHIIRGFIVVLDNLIIEHKKTSPKQVIEFNVR